MATAQQMFHVLECFHLFQAHFVLPFGPFSLIPDLTLYLSPLPPPFTTSHCLSPSPPLLPLTPPTSVQPPLPSLTSHPLTPSSPLLPPHHFKPPPLPPPSPSLPSLPPGDNVLAVCPPSEDAKLAFLLPLIAARMKKQQLVGGAPEGRGGAAADGVSAKIMHVLPSVTTP